MPSIKGTSSVEDTRSLSKALKATKFPVHFQQTVDITKLNRPIMVQWIEKQVTDYLGFEDEIVQSTAVNLFLPEKSSTMDDTVATAAIVEVDPRQAQIALTGFLGSESSSKFCSELWELMIDGASNQPLGIPRQLLEAKKKELAAKEQQLQQQQQQQQQNRSSRHSSSVRSHNNHHHGHNNDRHQDPYPPPPRPHIADPKLSRGVEGSRPVSPQNDSRDIPDRRSLAHRGNDARPRELQRGDRRSSDRGYTASSDNMGSFNGEGSVDEYDEFGRNRSNNHHRRAAPATQVDERPSYDPRRHNDHHHHNRHYDNDDADRRYSRNSDRRRRHHYDSNSSSAPRDRYRNETDQYNNDNDRRSSRSRRRRSRTPSPPPSGNNRRSRWDRRSSVSSASSSSSSPSDSSRRNSRSNRR